MFYCKLKGTVIFIKSWSAEYPLTFGNENILSAPKISARDNLSRVKDLFKVCSKCEQLFRTNTTNILFIKYHPLDA